MSLFSLGATDLLKNASTLRASVGVLAAASLLLWAGPAPAQNPIGAGAVPSGEYEIGPEDLLEVSVWKEKDLQREVLVRPDGWLTFPLVGNVRAKGRTAQHLQEEITDRLRKYIPDPVVTVSIKKVAGYKIYVIGKVNKPGEYVVGRYVDVLQALTLAGGLTPFAAEDDIRVVRKLEDESGAIKETVLRFDYSEAKKGRRLEQNIVLKTGDVVVVP
jgi:polysaccharide export outer membrane protein